MTQRNYPQIKVCGLTRPDEAVACAELGADAIGLVFYPKSPRNVSMEQAAAITAQLSPHVKAVGVFVNPDMNTLTRTITQCGLHGVQLHGSEPAEFVKDLKRVTQAKIYKVLFSAKSPGFEEAGKYKVNAFLVECGQGKLPGGNAEAWEWSLAEPFGRTYPLILAGGLNPNTVSQAIADSLPDAVDASSGLEASPGRKDLTKVERFINAVRLTAENDKIHGRNYRLIF